MNVKYDVQPQQYTVPPPLQGELILAKLQDRVVGKTGYVEWNLGEYAYNGLNNAIMKIANSFSSIEVDQSVRGNGIGLGLLDKLLDQLVKKSFEQLIIPLPVEKGFYAKSFKKLKEDGKITSVHRNITLKLGHVYEVRL